MADKFIDAPQKNLVTGAAEQSTGALESADIAANTESYKRCLVDMAVRLHAYPNGAAAAPEAVAVCNEALKYDLPKLDIH